MSTADHLSENTKYLARQVDLASWQCAVPHTTYGRATFGHETKTTVGSSAVLSRLQRA